MTRDTKYRLIWMVPLALIGYLIPAITGLVPGAPSIHLPFGLVRTLVPIVNPFIGWIVEPDWNTVLFFFGPVNALLYALAGMVISQQIIEKTPSDTES